MFFRLLNRTRRTLTYMMLRIKRIQATPHKISLGFCIGVFVAFLPLVGFHFVISLLLALLLGGNLLSAMFGTFVFNPLTFPFIWIASFRLGQLIMLFYQKTFLSLGLSQVTDLGIYNFDFSLHTMKIMFMGGLPLGLIIAVCSYFPIRILLQRYQAHRHSRACNLNALDKPETL